MMEANAVSIHEALKYPQTNKRLPKCAFSCGKGETESKGKGKESKTKGKGDTKGASKAKGKGDSKGSPDNTIKRQMAPRKT